MATRYAWVLNLDADLELEAAREGSGTSSSVTHYTPTQRVRAAMRPHVARLSSSLVGPDDIVIDDENPSSPIDPSAQFLGRAFCPTTRALAVFQRAGIEPEPHPSMNVLRRVNSRAFCASLGATLPDSAFVTDRALAHTILGQRPSIAEVFRVKRAHGMAGRGQRVLSFPPTTTDWEHVERAIDAGGVQIEPNVAIVDELGLHGRIARDGSFALGSIVRQRCDARGTWTSTERLVDLSPFGDVPERLLEEGRRVARALALADYFGPFGLDAFTYRERSARGASGPEGPLRLQPRSEINARYSMGFAVGATPLLRLPS